jgi:molybdate transport system permease protein
MSRFLRLAPGALLLALLVVPILALAGTSSLVELAEVLQKPFVLDAIELSVLTSTASLVVVIALGTPLAWSLARRPSRLVELLVELPVVLPPAVVGVALLLTFGRRGLFGPLLGELGVGIAFTPFAVLLAQIVVAAPFYVLAAAAALRSVDPELLVVARSLGATPGIAFFRVAVPAARNGLVTGAALAWARALGEFGATLLFAGNLEGRTQTLPLAIYAALESDVGDARALALVLVAIAVALLASLRLTTWKGV